MIRTVPFVLASALLAGCVQPPPPDARAGLASGQLPPAGLPGRKVAVLVPLTGSNAGLGRDLLHAIQLALGDDGSQLDIQDTGGTPAGASLAAQAALRAQDAVIVGPLTAPETAAAAAVAAGIPILAFTSDRQQGRPGVWALGITPQQQVARLVQTMAQRGHTAVAAVLPANAFGEALADGVASAAAAVGAPPPQVRRYPNGRMPALDKAIADLSDYAHRGATADPADPALTPSVPPPFDVLLLGESGPALRSVTVSIAKYQAGPPAVQIIGPATWARDAANLSGLAGALYAAPDQATRGAFEQLYTARFGNTPPGIASIAYDAAQIARVAVNDPAALTSPGGFRGADGPIVLRTDGQVTRGLAVYAVGPEGPQVVEPVPASIASGS